MSPTTSTLATKSKTKAKKSNQGCGCSSTKPQQTIDPKIQERIDKHPCYSEDAHHHYARMHVAVAPACNISVISVIASMIVPMKVVLE
jgi:nitrogen fixation protein NifB